MIELPNALDWTMKAGDDVQAENFTLDTSSAATFLNRIPFGPIMRDIRCRIAMLTILKIKKIWHVALPEPPLTRDGPDWPMAIF